MGILGMTQVPATYFWPGIISTFGALFSATRVFLTDPLVALSRAYVRPMMF